MSNPVAVYDITIKVEIIEFYALKQLLKDVFKHWAFQKERGEGGYIHWQVRGSLKVRQRWNGMKKWCGAMLQGAHCTPTSITNKDNMFYVMKEETRLEGPWTSKDPEDTYVQQRFRGAIEWREWQNDLLEDIKKRPNDRNINILLSPKGNDGKTFLATYIHTMGLGRRIPAQREARDIMRMVMDMPKATCYLMDLPRATSKHAQEAIYASLEEIKNGYAYDDRYGFKEQFFEPPHIWVFTNHLPDKNLLSRDRWIYWRIGLTGLEVLTEQEASEHVGCSKATE